MSKQIISTLCLVFCAQAWAYLPPYSMIMARTAENHGKGSFVIDQDLIYHDAAVAEVVHETWTVFDDSHMQVVFQGGGPIKDSVSGSFIYENRNRVGNDAGSIRSHRLADSWLEPFFFFRSSKAMRAHLVQMKIAPQESLRDKAPMKSEGAPDYEPESFIKLVRQNGMIAWAIARAFDSNDEPELWIEQDQFVVTKVRPEAQLSVEAEDYARFEGGLYFPRVRTYRWRDKSVTVQVRSVRTITHPKLKDVTNTAGLKPLQFSGSSTFKDFYLRFR